MATPTYLPAPQNANSYLSPFVPKYNYQQLPPQPQTNQDQTLLSPCMVDVSCLGLTSFKCVTQFTVAASTGAMVLNNYGALWLNATNTAPILARSTTGTYTITWPQMVSHEYTANLTPPVIDNIPVIFTFGFATITALQGGYVQPYVSVSGNVITVKLYDTAAALFDAVGSVINVGVI
jgi:hypothetical protein